jgi:hypothetical protein
MVALALASPSIDDPTWDQLAAGLHAALTAVGDPAVPWEGIQLGLTVAELIPTLVAIDDLVPLVRAELDDVRQRAHRLLDRLGASITEARLFDRVTARRLDDGQLLAALVDPHVIGRFRLVAEAGRRGLQAARPLITRLLNATIDRCDHVERTQDLSDADAQMLTAAVHALHERTLDPEMIRVLDRMLRHPLDQVKADLLRRPFEDDRLIDGMSVVATAGEGWQRAAATTWLAARRAGHQNRA